MTTLTEGRHSLEFLLSEAPGVQSRDNIVVGSGAGKLAPGTVLGKASAGTATPAAWAGNTANSGALTMDGTTPTLAGIKLGKYKVTCIEPATNSGKFEVEDPDGIVVGVATVGSAFTGGGLKFTIADGSGDFVSGDGFDIVVAAGSGKFYPTVLTAYDGSAVGCAILGDWTDASSADQTAMAITRDADVVLARLTFDASVSDAGKKATKIGELAAVGIRAR
jgi:hypothetical protein